MLQGAKNILRKFRVNEISLVDEGDNPHADVLILKRRDNVTALKSRFEEASLAAGQLIELAAGAEGDDGVQRAATILKGMNMDIEQLNERLAEIESNLETVTKRATDAEARVSELEGELANVTKERDEAVAKAKAEASDEDVLKGLPEPIRKRLEDAERAAREATEQVEKAREERELSERVTKAKELGLADADGMAALMQRVAKGKTTPEDEAKLIEVLQIAKNVGDKGSQLFTAIGKANGSTAADTEAEGELEAKIADVRKAKPTLSREQAYAEVIEANPGLYDRVAKIRPSVAA